MSNLNEFYLPTGWPTTNGPGASSPARSEFSLLQTGLNRLPPLFGFALLMVRVNATGTALESVSYATATVETYADVQAGGQILVAAAKTAPVAGDIWGMLDSAAGNILRQVTFQNLFNAIGVLINAATSKATPVNADSFLIQDSAASNVSKQLTLTNLATYLSGVCSAGWNALTATTAGSATNIVSLGNAAYLEARYGSAMLPFTCTQASNLLTGTLTAPFKIDLRNVTLTTGTPTLLEQASTLSLAMTNIAGSLGAITAQPTRLVWALVYAAGAPQIAVANISGGLQMDETNLITTATIGVGSTSATTWYSTSAIGTSSQYRIIGFTDATWTSGTGWGSPTTVQPVGTGQALSAMSAFGYGQTWQDVHASRAMATTYYNTTQKPIQVETAMADSGSTNYISILTVIQAGVTTTHKGSQAAALNANSFITVTIPPGASYALTDSAGNPAISTWLEMR